MDGADTMSEALQSSNWEVYKDAFAPQPPSRRVKPWERAPVPAHAPRLQGQKVWKKRSAKAQPTQDDKENHERAQAELETAGMGARKRARVMGGKENIGDARWKELGEPSPTKVRLSMSPRKMREVDDGDLDALLVPRKRTNANHIITPRKPVRKIALGDKGHAGEGVQTKMETLDVAPSPAKLSPQKIPLNDMAEEGRVAEQSEKPVRRRKSLRRSTRRLTRGASPEQVAATPANDGSISQESSSAVAESAAEIRNHAYGSLAIEAVHDTTEESKGLVAADVQEPISPMVIEDSSVPLEEDTAFATNAASATPVTPKAKMEDSTTKAQDLQGVGAIQTPKLQLSVLDPAETGSDAPFVSPAKRAGTPRLRRKAPPRASSRHSTRWTRANPVPPEDQSAQEPAVSETANSESLYPSSPAKIQVIECSTLEANNSANNDLEKNLSTAVVAMEDIQRDLASTTSSDIEPVSVELEPTGIEDGSAAQPYNPIDDSDQPSILDLEPDDMSSNADAEGEDRTLDISAIFADTTSFEIAMSPRKASPRKIDVTPRVDYSFGAIIEAVDEHSFSPQPKGLAQPDVDVTMDGMAEDVSEETLKVLEPISISISTENLVDETVESPTDDLPESSTPNPSTTELVETISENAPVSTFDHDDTDMLRSFLTRVKANKAAKAGTSIPKRKRSLPHSPIRLPLGTDSGSPSAPESKEDFDIGLPKDRSTKRKQDDTDLDGDEAPEPKSIRRSGRTRLPVKAVPLAAPSFIPVRRQGQDGDNTITLKRSEEKELAALTRVNTRKNKGVALPPLKVLEKQAEDKDDPFSRQRALKEVFDEKAQRQKKGKKRKTVVWAEVLAQFQTEDGKTMVLEREPEKEKAAPVEEKKKPVKVGVRSKMTLGMAPNGTPAPKKKMRGRS